MKARRLVQHGGWAVLACVVNTKEKKKTIDTVPIVNEFHDVFSEDLSGIPPSLVVDFGIELEQGMRPISKAPIIPEEREIEIEKEKKIGKVERGK